MSEGASVDLKIILDGLTFLNSYWKFYGVNVEIINCHAASLVLELQHLAHAIIQNCTFGYWKFRKVQNTFIKNCNNVFHEDVPTSLKFYNSSAYIKNMTIENENFTGDFNGIVIYDYSLVHVEKSKFVKNTVVHGIIKTMSSSSLIMSNCDMLENYAIEGPGVVYANKGFIHVENTYFNGNMAAKDGGAIYIQHMSFLKITNCTFKNNNADKIIGVGGAIFSNNSVLDISYSIFDGNKAGGGGAIQQQIGKMKINRCSFFENFYTAVAGWSSNEMSIVNSIFEKNLAYHSGGAVSIVEKSVINISNTIFKNNIQISSFISSYPYYIHTDSIGGGGAMFISQSVGNISKSTFKNNVASAFGGAISTPKCFLNIEYSTFQNNSVLNKLIGMGGGLFLYDNSTIKISNVLFSKCHGSVGGAIGTNFTTIIMSSSSVTANTGSAIHLLPGDTLEINNCTFFNNSAPQYGGAILCEHHCVLKITNTTFDQNRAVQSGGAVSVGTGARTSQCTYNMLSNLTAVNCSFTNNIAYDGGAMTVFYSVFNISDSNFSNNIATDGGVVVLFGTIVMTNCRMSNNTAHGNGGVVHTTNGTLFMSNCRVFDNTANMGGGVIASSGGSKIIITTSIFKTNTALGYGGVFSVYGGTTLLRNSWFVKNIAGLNGGLLSVLDGAVINIIESFCFENKAHYDGGMLSALLSAKIFISDTIISKNSANINGAMSMTDSCIVELYRSHIEGNNAEKAVGALLISDNSLFVAVNCSLKGNSAFTDSTIGIVNSTVYLEKCTFLQNKMTSNGGTIYTDAAKLKVSDSVFAQNEGYDIMVYKDSQNSTFETHRCLFLHGNVSLRSDAKNFEQVAVKEKVIGRIPFLNQSFFKPGETPYASSKIFHNT